MYDAPLEPTTRTPSAVDVAIMGGGLAVLMAAVVCAGAGLQVAVFDAMSLVRGNFTGGQGRL